MITIGAVLVATSNRPPRDLYKNGLQRSLFLPFIDILESKAIIHSIADSSTDYRVLKSEEQARNLYLFPLTTETAKLFSDQFDKYRQLTLRSHETSITAYRKLEKYSILPANPLKIIIHGHKVLVPTVVLGRRIAKFSFYDLCHAMLGPEDFVEMSKLFYLIFIYDVPVMSLNNRDEIRRFITCIDAFYEAGICLIMTANAKPTDLLQQSKDERQTAVFDEIFAFDRTISRLLEMQSVSYLKSTTSKFLQGLDYVENIMNKYLSKSSYSYQSKDKVSSSQEDSDNNSIKSEITSRLWDYYYIPCQYSDYKMLPTLSNEIFDIALRDILIIMKIRNPNQLQVLYYKYEIREPISNIVINEDIVESIKSKYHIETIGVSRDIFDQVIYDLIS